MTKLLDIIMIILDLGLLTYFFNYALNTTDITIRLLSCALASIEILFIIKHIKIMKTLKMSNNKKK